MNIYIHSYDHPLTHPDNPLGLKTQILARLIDGGADPPHHGNQFTDLQVASEHPSGLGRLSGVYMYIYI